MGGKMLAVGGIALLLPVGADSDTVDLDASWQNGIRLSSEDGSTKIALGGVIMNDWIFHRGDQDLVTATGAHDDGTEFRRIRLSVGGTVRNATVFKVQLDFAGGRAQVKDAYVGLRDVPGLGTVLVGDQFEPVGLETQTSSKSITFVERSLTGAFVPDRNSGITASNESGPATVQLGVFRDSDGVGFSQGDGEYAATGRFSVRLRNEDGGRSLLHVGAAGSVRHPPGDEVRFDQRPENHLAPKYVDTGALDSEQVTVAGLEAALVQGPFSLQSEYIRADVSLSAGRDPTFSAVYGAASFFFTGEHRPFNGSTATFGRVSPRRAFDGGDGHGAWELAARFSRVDLDDAGISGGTLADFTAALNWYLNPNVRWMLNYVRADLEDVGASDAVLARVQADF